MPWKSIKLNDGRHLPGVGFGSSGHPKERTADDIELAIGSGFEHIDTAQSKLDPCSTSPAEFSMAEQYSLQ